MVSAAPIHLVVFQSLPVTHVLVVIVSYAFFFLISYDFYCVVDKSSLYSSLCKLNLHLLVKNPAYHAHKVFEA